MSANDGGVLIARPDKDRPVIMGESIQLKLPKWLYQQIGQETAYWSIGKNLMIVMTQQKDEPEVKLVSWEINKYLQRSD